ncbi:MAG: hypothetical protein PHV18_15125 [Lachnospiraceae bacterium]|nr:hypothetical protein [Lachnospiraceae bacterium]
MDIKFSDKDKNRAVCYSNICGIELHRVFSPSKDDYKNFVLIIDESGWCCKIFLLDTFIVKCDGCFIEFENAIV